MLTRTNRPVAVLCVVMLLAQGCAFYEKHRKAIVGAGIGAAAGAAVGGLAKGSKGALVGGLIGALAGGAVGAYLDHKDKSAQETKRDLKYTPAQGVRTELVAVAAEPNTVAPGGKVQLRATYAVMAPSDQQEVAFTETRIVTLGGAKVVDTSINVKRPAGTYTSEVPITLPTDAAKGRYELIVTIAGAGQQSQLSSFFVVN